MPALVVTPRGESATFEVFVDSEQPLGAFSFRIACAPDIADIVAPIRGGASVEFSDDPFQNVTGGCAASFSNFQAQALEGPTGVISVAFVTLRVHNDARTGGQAEIMLAVDELTDTLGESIPHTVASAILSVDGSVTTTLPLSTTLTTTTLVVVTTTLEVTTTTMPPATTTTTLPNLCGDAVADGMLTIADALAVLRGAVGLGACPLAACDVDGNSSVSAADALALLRFVVGLPVDLACP